MNLLIADDEPLIHVSIQCTIEALELPDINLFHVSSGREMLSRMQEVPIDLALVDIRMPGMTGLEAISAARALWPKTSYYIMSGYSEFEYARDAIKLGVTEYLLKPLSPEQLSQVIQQVREKQEKQSYQVRSAFSAWLEAFLAGHGADSLYQAGCYTVGFFAVSDDPGQEGLSDWAAQVVPMEREHVLTCAQGAGVLGLLYVPPPQACLAYLQQIPSRCPEDRTLFVSPMCGTSAQLRRALEVLLGRNALRVYWGAGRRYDLPQLQKASRQEMGEAEQWVKLREHLLQQNYPAYFSQCARLAQWCRLPLSAPALESLTQFFRWVAGPDLSLTESGAGLGIQLRQLGEDLLQQSRSDDKIDAVLAYVEEHFAQDISIASLSDQFHLSPNYLSTLLKKRLGKKFTEHLTGLRLSYAKTLLRTTQLPVREIAEQVGYYSLSYFTKLFIDKTGCTPAEYRNKP